MENTRTKKLALNTITSVLFEIVSVICGLILPRLIIQSYGSEVNGLINSITQFLGIITLLNLGVGIVVETALYKPLANKNNEEISKIYISAQKFFKKIAYILIVYIIILFFLYPKIINSAFDFFYVDTLIFAISISSLAQYFFGMVNSLVMSADQKGYVIYSVQIVTLVINTLVCSILIKLNFSIQFVKLTTSIIFLARPLFYLWYVNKKFKIDKKIKYSGEPIKQKWNGIAQHVAWTIFSGTDSIILTLFSSLSNVSIYAVYNFVMNGVKSIITSLSAGFRALMGNMIAKNEIEKLNKFFGYVEWFVHTSTTLVFGITGVLIVNFVKVYTKGVTDVDYIQPLFGFLITIANSGMCYRLPYNTLISAAGHYKQTQNNYIITAVINIAISVIMVFKFGLIGVAVGTLVAIFYQTIWMAWYNSKNIIYWPFKKFLKQIFVDIIVCILSSIITFKIPMLEINYKFWILLAIEVSVIWLIISFIINIIFFKEELKSLLSNFKIRIQKGSIE